MSNGVNGVTCLLYSGEDYESKKQIIGQGDATLTHNGDGIEINNKSTGGFREYLDDPSGNNSTTRSLDIAVQLTFMDDQAQAQEIADAHAKVIKSYIFDFGRYYYVGKFLPKINTESAVKDQAVTLDISYMSSGAFERVIVGAA